MATVSKGRSRSLLILGGFGARHRTRTLPAMRDGRRGAFIRLAAGELVVFAATLGLAVALSRSLWGATSWVTALVSGDVSAAGSVVW